MYIRYRLAPEHPFPTPLNDCEKVTSYLLRKPEVLGIDVKRIAIAGKLCFNFQKMCKSGRLTYYH